MLLTLLPPAQTASYTWHSARIYLACALKAAGASSGQIQALCRWVSEQSLHIYARLNETTYSYWLNRAMVAPVNSSTLTTSLAAGLPTLDDDDVVRCLLTLNNLVEHGGLTPCSFPSMLLMSMSAPCSCLVACAMALRVRHTRDCLCCRQRR